MRLSEAVSLRPALLAVLTSRQCIQRYSTHPTREPTIPGRFSGTVAQFLGQSQASQPSLVMPDSLVTFAFSGPLRLSFGVASHSVPACHSVLLMPTSTTVVAVDAANPSNLSTPLSSAAYSRPVGSGRPKVFGSAGSTGQRPSALERTETLQWSRAAAIAVQRPYGPPGPG